MEEPDSKSFHLVVMQHGLWGEAKNMKFLEDLLMAEIDKLGIPADVLNSQANEKMKTYEGVDACGDRLTSLIVETLNKHAEQGRPVTHLSLIGYSMGGLMTRYAAGKLFTLGAFGTSPRAPSAPTTPRQLPPSQPSPQEAPEADGGVSGTAADPAACPALTAPPVLPLNFITIASPHLGTWMLPTSWWTRTFNTFVPRVTARAGTHFMLLDKHAFDRPLLVNMADPALPFMQGLSCFKHHMLLANTLHDRSVPYCTAAITDHNPYEEQDSAPVHPDYPSVVKPVPRQLKACRTCSRSRAAANHLEAPAPGGGQDDGDVPLSQAGGGPPEAAATPHTGWRKGWGMRVTFLLLLPFTFPLVITAIAYALMVGRRQWAAVVGCTFDHSWVVRASHPPSQPPSQPGTAGGQPASTQLQDDNNTPAAAGQAAHTQEQAPAIARVHSSDVSLLVPRESGSGTHVAPAVKHGLLTQITGRVLAVPQPELHDLSVRKSAELPRASKQRRKSIASVEDVDVTIDGGAKELHVHQGLVDTPGSEQEAQLWMMNHLNKLPWVKVDVDTRHYHAHAAIMVRMPSRFADNADCLKYLVDHMVLRV